jgi:hypothetical protein
MPTSAFKTCPKCRFRWRDRNKFLSDPLIRLIGYQVNVPGPVPGLFLFNHLAARCSTTMAIAAEDFLDLHRGPVFRECLAGKPGCPRHCLRQDDLDPCPAACECRFVRDVLQVGQEVAEA